MNYFIVIAEDRDEARLRWLILQVAYFFISESMHVEDVLVSYLLFEFLSEHHHVFSLPHKLIEGFRLEFLVSISPLLKVPGSVFETPRLKGRKLIDFAKR